RPVPDARFPPMLLAGGSLLALVPALQGAVGVEIVPSVRAFMTEGTTVVVVAACAVTVLLAALFARGIAAAALVLLGMAAFTFSYLQAESIWVSYLPWANRYWTRASCVSNEQSYREILRLVGEFRSENPVWWQTWIWNGPEGERTFG